MDEDTDESEYEETEDEFALVFRSEAGAASTCGSGAIGCDIVGNTGTGVDIGVGAGVGSGTGADEGSGVGDAVGDVVGETEGDALGIAVALMVGDGSDSICGSGSGSMAAPITINTKLTKVISKCFGFLYRIASIKLKITKGTAAKK